MGNTLIKSNSDRRFNDSTLSKEVTNILLDQTEIYNDRPIKVNIAKACCLGVISPNVDENPNNILSIAFPEADLNSDRCKNEGMCLKTVYTGLQIKDDTQKYCGNSSNPGLAGQFLSKQRTAGGGYNMCDAFMIDKCAKSLYDQGCIRMGKNRSGSTVAQFADTIKMCWDEDRQMNYGPPECACINSIFGPTLNTWPSRKVDNIFNAGNPYGLSGPQTSGDNLVTKYSLNIFKTDPSKQFPRALDDRCIRRISGDTGLSGAYTWEPADRSMTICLNQINLADSNIGTANLKDIKQDNNCGGPPPSAQRPTTDSVPIDPDTKVDSAEATARARRELEEAQAQQRVQEEARAKARADAERAQRALEEANARALAQQRALEEANAKARADAERAQRALEEASAKARADAERTRIALEEAKQREIERIRKETEETLIRTQQIAEEQANKLLQEETSRRNIIVFGVLGVIVIAVALIFILKPKKSIDTDDD